MPSLFGTSGIRGPAISLFTPQFCFDVGRAFALFLDNHDQKGAVCLGIDSRTSSPHLAQNLISGLRFAGRDVIHLGTLPVPAANYALISGGYGGSVMVTGSHIDSESNGVKFFVLKEEITKIHEQEISDIYFSLKEQTPSQNIAATDITNTGLNNYVEMLLGLADLPLARLKIVVDPGNGGQTEVVKTVLSELGSNFIPVNAHIQEPLISRDTEQDGAFASLQAAVRENQADLGVGFDSDGDRAVFVDAAGNFVPGDYTGALLAKWNATDVVVCPVNVSNVINYLHKEVIRTRVGSPFVIEAMKKYGANFGFESNGGCIHEDIMFSRDGGSTFIKMLNLLKWSKKSLAELVAELPRFYIRRAKFACPTERFDAILAKAPHFLTSVSLDQTDGIKLNLDKDTWVLFRPSGNAPEFRVFVESNSATKADQLLQSALTFAQNV